MSESEKNAATATANPPVDEGDVGGTEFLVHTKHACDGDGCFVQPIVGRRYRSVARPNFDLCARCFEGYAGPVVGLEEVALLRDKKHTSEFVLKLKIQKKGDAQVRRIKVSELWDKSTARLSFERLMSIAFGFAKSKDDDDSALDAFIAKAKATYVDGDGDKITMTSDEELEDSFFQVIKDFPAHKPFRITVSTNKGGGGEVRGPGGGNAKRIQYKNYGMGGGNANRRIHLKNHGPGGGEVLEVGGNVQRIILKNLGPGGGEVPEPTDRVQRKKVQPPAWTASPEYEEDSFIHARHTCDGCSESPIVGTRYHATKIPDFDLCRACFEKYEGEDLDFKPEIHDRDRRMQREWRKMRRLCESLKVPAKVAGAWNAANNGKEETAGGSSGGRGDAAAGGEKPPAPKAAKAEPVEKVPGSPDASNDGSFLSDADGHGSIAEVIGRTLDVCVQVMEEAMVDEAKEIEKPGTSGSPGNEASVNEDVAAAAALAADAFSVASSMVSDILKETGLGADVGKGSGVISRSNVDDEDASESAPSAVTGATILKAEDGSENAKEAGASGAEAVKVDDVSESEDEWSVVGDEKVPVKSPDSGGDNTGTDAKATEEEEDNADRSLSSLEPLSPVVVAKWDTELVQLHELGFLDDRMNVDVLERLEASYVAVDSTEKVTVQKAVEQLLLDLA